MECRHRALVERITVEAQMVVLTMRCRTCLKIVSVERVPLSEWMEREAGSARAMNRVLVAALVVAVVVAVLWRCL